MAFPPVGSAVPSLSNCKTCSRCRAEKDRSEFYFKSKSPDGLNGWCRDCCRAAQRIAYRRAYDANPEHYRRKARAWALAHREKVAEQSRRIYEGKRQRRLDRFKLTADDFVALVDSQGNVCRLCGTDDPGPRGTWAVDHDHSCCPGSGATCGGCIRGLLCHRCNMGLGYFKENPDLLEKAATYIRTRGRI